METQCTKISVVLSTTDILCFYTEPITYKNKP